VALFGLFKNKSEREQERRPGATKRDDMGWRAAEQITDLIDRYFDHVVLPASLDTRDVLLKYRDQVPVEANDGAVQTLSAHGETLDEFNMNIRQGAYEGLGELRYLVIESGIKDDILAYIDRRADELIASMRETRAS
jgi:hypothetical protein